MSRRRRGSARKRRPSDQTADSAAGTSPPILSVARSPCAVTSFPFHPLCRHAGILSAGAGSADRITAPGGCCLYATRSARGPWAAARHECRQTVCLEARAASRTTRRHLRDARRCRTHWRGWNADVMMVVAYGLILPATVLAIPPLGCLNIHASLLPRWRGAAPIHRALLAGDAQTGVTIMQMDAGLDTGPMLLERRDRDCHCDRHRSEPARPAGCERCGALLEALHGILDGSIDRDRSPTGRHLRCEESQGRGAGRLAQDSRRSRSSDSCIRSVAGGRNTLERPAAASLAGWRLQAEAALRFLALSLRAMRMAFMLRRATASCNVTRVQLAGRKAVSAAEFLHAHRLGWIRVHVSHSAAVRARAARIVAQVATHGRSLDALLVEDRSDSAQERGLLRSLCYDSIRWYVRLDELLRRLLARPDQALAPELHALCIVGLCQLLYSDVPEHAAVDETVNATRSAEAAACSRTGQCGSASLPA